MKLEEIIKTRGFESDNHRVMVNLFQLNYEFKSRMQARLKVHGLTLEQFNVLRILRGQCGKPICLNDIQARVIERSSNISRIVERLESKQLLYKAKDNTDKRNLAVSITDLGLMKIDEASSAMRQVEAELLNLSECDVTMLNEILDKARSFLYRN